MKLKFLPILITITGLTLLAGCGGGPTGDAAPKNTLAESQGCISCHDAASHDGTGAALTPGTQKPVVTEWMASTHNTANGASCRDCHGSGYLHDSTAASCSGCHSVGGQAVNPLKNPDASNQCAKCHDKVNPRPGQNDGYSPLTANGVPPDSTTRFTHFSTGKRANYVASNYRHNCRQCHNPHDNTYGEEQRGQWADSGHGNTRGLARTAQDFKTRGTNISLDKNIGNNNYCVRCHTSTGFINFVAGDAFTNVNALSDIGADGLPDPNGFRSNAPEYTTPFSGPYAGKIVNSAGIVFAYKDTSRETTGCNVCHLDIRSDSATNPSSYSGTLRKVAVATGVQIYYPYSSTGYKNVTPVQFDTFNNSNLCLTCHSGRATGKTISEPGLISSVVANKNPSAPNIHDFAGGAVLQGEKTAFLFYTSPTKYKFTTQHRELNADGNGPCITCHMPMVPSSLNGSQIHSHLFSPVTWNQDDLNQDITEIISNPTVCSGCHNDTFQSSLSPDKMNLLRKGFRVSLLILGRLLPQPFNKPLTGNGGWTGTNSNVTPNVTYGTAPIPALGNKPAAVYTMGANYDYSFLFNEPSSYAHSPILVRQLIYDSIDWLIHGATGFGTSPVDVYAAIKSAPFTTTTKYPANKTGLFWNKTDVVQGEILGISINKDYASYTDTPTYTADRDAALFYLCKNYNTIPITNPAQCERW